MFLIDKLKNYIIVLFLTLLPVFYMLGSLGSSKRRKVRELKKSNEVLRESGKIEENIKNLSTDDLDKRLDKWVRYSEGM